jgi:hypothetical protein
MTDIQSLCPKELNTFIALKIMRIGDRTIKNYKDDMHHFLQHRCSVFLEWLEMYFSISNEFISKRVKESHVMVTLSSINIWHHNSEVVMNC